MTTYLAAYDTEADTCLDALPRIIELHRKFEIPATLFIVARLLDEQGDDYRRLLGDDPLFEIASHSYTHMLLRDHPVCGKAGPKEEYEREIVESKRRIEELFGREVAGFRAPVSFEDGLRGAPDLLRLCDRARYGYVSTLAWGPNCSLPALINEPFTYAEEGYPGLWEVPPCGWHDNVMKEGNSALDPLAVQASPHPYPEVALDGYIKTAAEEAELDRKFIDRAADMGAPHVSLIWHPWSLLRFDPEMEMLEQVFQYVRDRGLPVSTFGQYVETLGGK